MEKIDGLELSEKIRQGFDQPCRTMIDQGIPSRAIVMAFLLQSFDLMLDEAADHSETRKVFLSIADAATRVRLDSLNIPNANAE